MNTVPTPGKFPGKLRPLALCTASVLSCLAPLAQAEPGESEAVLPVVITTATRTEIKLENAPGSVSVVSRKDIENTPRASLKELVSGLEGVVTGQLRGQSDMVPGMSIRGVSGSGRTMVLVDGVPISTSYAGENQVLGGVNVEDLQQVEVVRGPFSSLYGSSAMGGVINFVTAMPDKEEYRASFGYGDAFEEGRAQKALMRGYLSAAKKFNDVLKVKVSYGWMNSDGYRSDMVMSTGNPNVGGVTGAERVSSPTGGIRYLVGNTGRGEQEKQDLGIRAELQATDRDSVHFSYTRSNIHNQYQDPESQLRDSAGKTLYGTTVVPVSSFSSSINDMTNEVATLGWKHRFANSRLSLRYAGIRVDEWYTTANRTVQAGATSPLDGGAGVLTPRYSENHLFDALLEQPLGDTILLLGTQLKTTKSVADTYNLGNYTQEGSRTGGKTTTSGGQERVIALFGDWQIPVSSKLSASLGARYENWHFHDGFTYDRSTPANAANPALNKAHPSSTKDNISPKLTLGYQLLERTMLKSSWGTAFNAPNIRDLTRNYSRNVGGLTTTYQGNPNLKPETSQTIDLGIEQGTANQGLMKAYVFQTEISDMHSTMTTVVNSTTSVVDRVNVGKARIRGLELALTQPLTPSLRLMANYTHLDTKILSNKGDPASEGKQLTSVPRHMANLALNYDDSRYFGTLAYQYASSRYFNSDNSDDVRGVYGSYDAYRLVHAKLGYHVNRNLDLSLAISNLTDERYYNSVLTEGRAWFAQASLKF